MPENEKEPTAEVPGRKGAPQFRVIDHSEREGLHGREVQARIEVLRPDGSREIRTYFERTVELEDSCVRVSWQLFPGLGPLMTVTCTCKGHVEGGLRRDRVQTTAVLADGTVYRMPEQEVPVRLPAQSRKMSVEEVVAHLQEYVADLSVAIGTAPTPDEAVGAMQEFNKRRSGLEPKK
jgi:hypothetical protein